MTHKAPGKAHREGISLIQLMEMFPDEATATAWFEAQVWPEGRCCGHCGSLHTSETPNAKPMPYWCTSCRSYFSVRTGTAIERSKIPLRKWVIAIYLEMTSLKGVSSTKLHRDIGVSQKSASFDMFLRFPPMNASSTSTGPPNGPSLGTVHAWRMR